MTARARKRSPSASRRRDARWKPDIAQSPVYGTPKHQSSWNTHINGTTRYFDITIDRVCEPQIWRLFRGGGIFGEWKIETSCSD